MTARTVIRPSLALLALLLAAPSRAETLKVPADFDTIQAAVDAAVAGDVVQVSKGTWHENVVVTTAGIALRGKAGATIDGGYDGDCVLVQADDVVVSGFTLLHGGPPLVALGPGDGGPEAGGVHVVGAGALLSKLEVAACNDFGILLEGTGVIEKCEVDSCTGPGIEVDTDNFLGETVTEVTKNEITRCIDGIVLDDGPFLVEKNTCEDNADDGLDVDIPVPVAEGFPTALATTISKNTCRRNAGTGLTLFKGTGPLLAVDKNVLEGNGIGLLATGFLISVTKGTIDDSTYLGVLLQTTQGEFVDNKVRGNGFLGVIVQAANLFADGGSVDGSNLVEGNLIQDSGGDGLRIESDNNVVQDNTLKDNRGDGLHLIGSGVIFNDVLGNKVTGNGHDGIDNRADGTLISDNVCKDNGGADLAGLGDGGGSTDAASEGNVVGDETGLASPQELELDTSIL